MCKKLSLNIFNHTDLSRISQRRGRTFAQAGLCEYPPPDSQCGSVKLQEVITESFLLPHGVKHTCIEDTTRFLNDKIGEFITQDGLQVHYQKIIKSTSRSRLSASWLSSQRLVSKPHWRLYVFLGLDIVPSISSDQLHLQFSQFLLFHLRYWLFRPQRLVRQPSYQQYCVMLSFIQLSLPDVPDVPMECDGRNYTDVPMGVWWKKLSILS